MRLLNIETYITCHFKNILSCHDYFSAITFASECPEELWNSILPILARIKRSKNFMFLKTLTKLLMLLINTYSVHALSWFHTCPNSSLSKSHLYIDHEIY